MPLRFDLGSRRPGLLLSLLVISAPSAALAQAAQQEAPPPGAASSTPDTNQQSGHKSMPPVVVTAPKATRPSLAPSTTTPSQKIEPGGIGYPPVVGAVPVPARQAFQVPGEDPGYFFNLSSYAEGFGHSLADHGLYLHGATQNTTASVVSGGAKRITSYVGLGYWGFDVDTEKAFGLPGGLFDMTASTELGNDNTIDSTVGSKGYVPYAFTDNARLVNFYYSQSFFDHALQVTFGRIEAGYTATPYLSPGIHQAQWYCSFFSVSCGNTSAFSSNSSKAPYEVGSWGGFITIHPAPSWYIKGGVYENQPLEVTSADHLGWPGRDWGFNEAAGAFFPIQIGYVTTPLTSLYPTNFHIGGYYDSATFPDKYYNAKFRPIPSNPGAPLLEAGTGGIFTGLQQTVYRFSADPRSTRGVSLFFSGDWDVGGLQAVQQEYAAGFILTGLFPQRAADTFNVLISTQNFDPREKADRAGIAAVHHLAYRLRPESDLEVNYGFAPSPGMFIYPYVQYIDNPDQLTLAVPDPRDRHAVTVGVRTVIRFDVLFGLPQPHS